MLSLLFIKMFESVGEVKAPLENSEKSFESQSLLWVCGLPEAPGVLRGVNPKCLASIL